MRLLEEGAETAQDQSAPAQKNMNMRGVFLHVATDAAGSVFVILSALLVCFFPHSQLIYYIDPLLRFFPISEAYISACCSCP